MTGKNLILIIGGSGGIGKAIASDYLKEDSFVIIVGKEQNILTKVHSELVHISDSCAALKCDISETYDVYQLAKTILQQYGCPEVIINCAGYATYRTFEESDWDEIEDLLQVNLLGAMRCVKAFLPAMIERGNGTIVNVSSIAGRIILTPNGTYCVAKHALVVWSEVLKYELAHFGIRVRVICPGRVETSFFNHETFQKRKKRAETNITTTVQKISKATLRAVNGNQFLTYIPWTFGVLSWFLDSFPWILKPLYGRIVYSRIKTYYES